MATEAKGRRHLLPVFFSPLLLLLLVPPPTVFPPLYPAVSSSPYSSLVFNVSQYLSLPHAIGSTALFLRSPSTSSYSGDDQTIGRRVDKSRRYAGTRKMEFVQELSKIGSKSVTVLGEKSTHPTTAVDMACLVCSVVNRLPARIVVCKHIYVYTRKARCIALSLLRDPRLCVR